MNKRGFIFTFISVILISVLVLAFLIQYTSRTGVNIEKTNTEVETMNSFVKSLNNDYLPRVMQVSGNQAILALLNYTSEQKEYLGEGNSLHYIVNTITEGEYKVGYGGGDDGPKLEVMEIEGINYTLNDTLNEIKYLAESTGINFNFEEITQQFKQNMEVFQDNPWYVNISMVISYSIYNDNNDISWNYKSKRIKTSIPITSFRDPIYMIESGINITINKTAYDLPEQIEPHVLFTNFVKCSKSPNFLSRMEGSTTASENAGIESLVNLKDPGQSAIDYQYLMKINPGQLTQIPEGSGYYIDITHSSCYNF